MAKKLITSDRSMKLRGPPVGVGDVFVVTRDSPDLGLGQGRKMHVVWVSGGLMDVDVPSLDMQIAGVRVDHPDVARVQFYQPTAGAQIKREVEAILDRPRSGHGKRDLWQERMERVIWSQRPDGDRTAPLSAEEIERLRADILQSFEPKSKAKRSWLARKFGA